MSRKSRTLISPGQGGCWKHLFRDPIQGPSSDKPFINKTVLNVLMQTYPMNVETLFKAERISDGVDNINLYHIVKTDNGKTASDLLASLQHPFVLGSTSYTDLVLNDDPDQLDGPAIWGIGGEEENLVKAWSPLIMKQPPRTIADCQRLGALSRRFCYLAIIFDPKEVISDVYAYGTMISIRRIVFANNPTAAATRLHSQGRGWKSPQTWA